MTLTGFRIKRRKRRKNFNGDPTQIFFNRKKGRRRRWRKEKEKEKEKERGMNSLEIAKTPRWCSVAQLGCPCKDWEPAIYTKSPPKVPLQCKLKWAIVRNPFWLGYFNPYIYWVTTPLTVRLRGEVEGVCSIEISIFLFFNFFFNSFSISIFNFFFWKIFCTTLL